MAAKIFRINYKSDFILKLNSDAGWMTPFCIKFWTGAPSQAYFVGFDGTTYTHCTPVDGEPTKLLVQFDDHHLPIGDLKFQIGYHFTVDDFPTSVEDEVLNQASVIIEVDDAPAQVMLDLNGETAPEIEFSLPAYANEAQRIANEEQRIAHEAIRIVNEESRIAAETIRQQNETQRIAQETARVTEFAQLKQESETATADANAAATLANEKAALAADKAALADDAATLANQKAQLADDKAALADAAATLANDKAALAQQKAAYAQAQGNYAKAQGDYAKAQSETAQADHERAESDHTRAESDHDTAGSDHTQAGTDHTRAESDHTTAASDHTQAGTDHTRAESDHATASADHTQAGTDHTRAESDHATASADHTQAGQDHTRAESDHTRAESDHAAVEVYVDSLGAFDISAYHATGGVLAKYADLTAALGTNGANIPDTLRKGGMSVKFVLSSDNKYVQYRYVKNSVDSADFANVNNWVGGGSVEQVIAELGFNPTITLTPSATAEDWKLTGNGLCSRDASYKLVKYSVNAGDILRLNLSKDGDNVMQFQNAASVPAAGSNSNLVGSPYTLAINKLVKVPTGATYLIVSQLKANETNTVEKECGVDNMPIYESENLVRSGGVFSTILAEVNVIIGKGYDSTGQKVDSAVMCCTIEPIDVTAGQSLRWVFGATGYGSETAALVFYGSNGNVVAYYSGNNVERTIQVPENATKMHATFYKQGTDIGIYYSNTNTAIFIPVFNNGMIHDLNVLKSRVDAIESIVEYENYFIGNDDNYSYAKNIYDLIPNRIYRIMLKNPDYNISQVTVQTPVFRVASYTAAGVKSDIIKAYNNSISPRKSYYDFKVPSDSEYISVYGLANLGEIVRFTIEPQNSQNVYVGYGYNGTGQLVESNVMCCTVNPIDVVPNEFIVWVFGATGYDSSLASLLFYDSNGNLLAYYSGNAVTRTIQVPENATKAHVTFYVNGENIGLYYNSMDYFLPYIDKDLQGIMDLNENIIDDIFERNQDKIPLLTASCRFAKSSNTSKDFQLLIVADSHGDKVAVRNAVIATNKFDKIDAMIHVGDCVPDVFYTGSNQDGEWNDIVQHCEKPFYFVLGNHELQVYPQIAGAPTKEELYNAFIKASVDAGHLVSGEYAVNRLYWYHDFTDYGIRLIAIDEGEAPRVIDSTYWEPITYNSSLENYKNNYDYVAGSEVNVPNYIAYSFRATQNVHTVYYNNTVPSLKYALGTRWISQTQAQWFLDTLASTPSGYRVIVVTHRPYSALADTDNTRMFNEKPLNDGYGIDSYMVNDFIADAINAFQTKSYFSTECSSTNPEDMPSYIVSKDFSNVVGTFHSLIGGHDHADLVWKHRNYNQYQITPVDANTTYYGQSTTTDIRRSNSNLGDRIDVDCLTVASFGSGRIGLVKLGVNVTDKGKKRDFEVMDISGN